MRLWLSNPSREVGHDSWLPLALQEQTGEGCHLYGKLLVNKVAGNFHIAPGKSFQQVCLGFRA